MENSNNCFFSKRYIATVENLKKNGLWDLEYGLLFLPIIQYCMPAPSISKVSQLLENLIKCEVDTDWAPLEVSKKLLRKVRTTKVSDENIDDKSWGTDYAIAYGINRIANLPDWPTSIKEEVIKNFTFIIHKNMAASNKLSSIELYTDIYQLRDVLLLEAAKNNNLQLKGNSTLGENDKLARIAVVLRDERSIGQAPNTQRCNKKFWKLSPKISFTIRQKKERSSDQIMRSIDADSPDHEATNEDYLLNNLQQQQSLFSIRPTWVRSNVRSLADGSQLSWTTIFQYWEFLLKQEKTELFLLSLICFLTGIPKRRWINISTAEAAYSLDNIILIESRNKLSYRVKEDECSIPKQVSPHNIASLQLPDSIKLTIKSIKKGLNEESSIKAFNSKFPGPSPVLNSISRSGHTLLRKEIKGETLSFLMSGTVPIEFKSRSAYLQTNDLDINELFKSCLTNLKEKAALGSKQYPALNHALMEFNNEGYQPNSQSIGSYLAQDNWAFHDFNIPQYSGSDLKHQVELLNHLSLYFFWMMQFAIATRASGKQTSSISIGGYRLHKDKDSKDFIEAKVLIIPELLKSQEIEVEKAIEKVAVSAHQYRYKFERPEYESYDHYLFKVNDRRLAITASPLHSKQALKLTREFWGIQPLYRRSNAHRHQSATFMHQQLSEIHADTWLGHHIDGWYFSAPESSASHQVLADVLDFQNAWLEKLGFHLVRNPLV